MEEVKKKKPIFKRWWFWVIIVVVIFIAALSGGDDTSKPASTVKKETFNFSKAELTKENVAKAISSTFGKNELISVDVGTAKGVSTVIIVYDPKNALNEKALVTKAAISATDAMEILFKNPKTDKVLFWTQTNMVDAKGNSSKEKVINVTLTKGNAKDINWANFKPMVQLDYNKLFDIADDSFISPGITKNIK